MDRKYTPIQSTIRYFRYKKLPKALGDSCIIMGNGPSLKHHLTADKELLQNSVTMAVNHFAYSDHYTEIKPNFYCLMDPALYRKTDNPKLRKNQQKLFSLLNTQTTWDMNAVFPADLNQLNLEKELYSNNVHLMMCNIFPGYSARPGRHLAYRSGFFMPPITNVLCVATFLAVNMGYRNIYLIGAEHSWSECLRVNNENTLCITNHHFTGESHERPVIAFKRGSRRPIRIYEMFRSLSKTFFSYALLEEYARSRGVKIYNATPNSYIDAFERKALP